MDTLRTYIKKTNEGASPARIKLPPRGKSGARSYKREFKQLAPEAVRIANDSRRHKPVSLLLLRVCVCVCVSKYLLSGAAGIWPKFTCPRARTALCYNERFETHTHFSSECDIPHLSGVFAAPEKLSAGDCSFSDYRCQWDEA